MAVIGIDLGGSGSRIAVVGDRRIEAEGPPFAVIGGHAAHADAVRALARRAPAGESVTAVAVSAAGLISLGDPDVLGEATATLWPDAVIVVVSDAVAAVMGAWGSTGGAIVAAGTGVIAFGTDFEQTWRRSDGWGHELGDDGGAAWIGARGLSAALRSVDGRPGASPALLDGLRERFGDPLRVPEAVRSAPNPASVLAAFAPQVSAAARRGDVIAQEIISAAARELAQTGLSVMGEAISPRLALVGGLSRDEVIAEAFTRHVRELGPDLVLAVDAGTPLDGAVAFAQRASTGAVRSRPPYLISLPPQRSHQSIGAS
ncbi:N-acetylglucosamine kinase [Microbacterium sp. SSM24]|uniref:N-acetylglucosamine kinase n=1 Tax=Microbacterium sp. SSM24 TaxID=2991714 RepID=UPI002225F9E2|nr:BadF/BadG/BcrA/BcrD ATPase family protein [Microbacterium sp. SSM24]MCW3492562.1 hypothetical protein [Microbacterium sp. SSM24]